METGLYGRTSRKKWFGILLYIMSLYNSIATKLQRQRPYTAWCFTFHQEASLPAMSSSWKTICFFLCGHFTSTAATWATVWCKKRIQFWGGMFCRKVCVPGYAYVLSEDIEASVLSSDLLPVSNVSEAHCAVVCTHACEGPFTASRPKCTGHNQMETKQHNRIFRTMSSVRLPPN